MLDERKLLVDYSEEVRREFLKKIEEYDESLVLTLLARGYTLKNRIQRTVVFLVGEITFYRNRWYRDGELYIPVDEWLGLDKYDRFSKEVEVTMLDLSLRMSYQQVTEVLSTMYHLSISSYSVFSVLQRAGELLRNQRDFMILSFTKEEMLRPIDVLYLEGDDVLVKTSGGTNVHLHHYIVHCGSKEVGENRFCLVEKKEFVGLSISKVREEMLSYIQRTYKITESTLLITNSDGGVGYSYRSFCNIARELKIKQHEYFWDEFHVLREIRRATGLYPEQASLFFKAIYNHDRDKLKVALDTLESCLQTDKEIESFQSFSKRLRRDFIHTKSCELRGISKGGIGIIESNHRKLTYRMKNRGMYWSDTGAETIAKLIVLEKQGELRDLIFGDWRKEFEEFEELNNTVDWRFSHKRIPKTYEPTAKLHAKLKL
ncbi:ISLre2 family transposase [Streptococcus danieliae]|uniref:ISLre2 family transposase n=1 Tax=Streptococcus danieliae TaxID=747656 RepID=A0A7X3KBQ6_9STRE|nr:ISLre2 family transposase [Streptococcus danieliae]MVX58122.1 ISLre2 family transposase [Streptococcus danieliae]NYS33699.1 ISLre2 family transposase [Streptococcus danieliae]